MKIFKITALISIIAILNSCQAFKYKKVDAREFPPEPEKRIKKNMEEGRGFRLMDRVGSGSGGTFDFASSNELWRASLDIINFMPLASANYSGGIIVTDWYNDGDTKDESIKISIRFLTNEIRVDALEVKVFIKNCDTVVNCSIKENKGKLVVELKKKILEKAAIYKAENKSKKKKREYIVPTPGDKTTTTKKTTD